MLVTLLLSWLLAAEPACRSECAATQAAVAGECRSNACGREAITAKGAGCPEVLSFEAPWCGPCQQMKSVLARLKKSGVRVRHVDVDREPELARELGIRNIPAFVSVVNGRPVRRVVGATSYGELMDMALGSGATSPAPNEMAPGATQVDVLVRAKYELCPEKAAAMTRFLEEFAVEDADVRNDEGTLTVTASPEIQRAIGQMISAVVNPKSQAGGCVSTAVEATRPVVHSTIDRDSACTAARATASCDRGCSDECTNECEGRCTTGCEDGVARGVAVPDAPGVPLVPPVWMPPPASARFFFGTGVNSNAGVVGRVVLDKPPVLPPVPLVSHHGFRGAGAMYTLSVSGDREFVDDVRKYVETKTRQGAADAAPEGRLIFSTGLRSE